MEGSEKGVEGWWRWTATAGFPFPITAGAWAPHRTHTTRRSKERFSTSGGEKRLRRNARSGRENAPGLGLGEADEVGAALRAGEDALDRGLGGRGGGRGRR